MAELTNNKYHSIFRMLFFIGTVGIMISLFFQYYQILGYDETGSVIASWSYYPFFGWVTPLAENGYNAFFRPSSGAIPFYLSLYLAGNAIFSLYVLVVKNIEKNAYREIKTFLYVHLSLLMGTGVLVFAVPIVYFSAHGLYFPCAMVNYGSESVLYCAGIGYFILCASFACVFPYAIFSYLITITYRSRETTPTTLLNRAIARSIGKHWISTD